MVLRVRVWFVYFVVWSFWICLRCLFDLGDVVFGDLGFCLCLYVVCLRLFMCFAINSVDLTCSFVLCWCCCIWFMLLRFDFPVDVLASCCVELWYLEFWGLVFLLSCLWVCYYEFVSVFVLRGLLRYFGLGVV